MFTALFNVNSDDTKPKWFCLTVLPRDKAEIVHIKRTMNGNSIPVTVQWPYDDDILFFV